MPAGTHLFQVNNTDHKLLCNEQRDSFVHIVMQLLYLSQRARPDVGMAVSFLCRCLSKPDKDDDRRATQVIK